MKKDEKDKLKANSGDNFFKPLNFPIMIIFSDPKFLCQLVVLNSYFDQKCQSSKILTLLRDKM